MGDFLSIPSIKELGYQSLFKSVGKAKECLFDSSKANDIKNTLISLNIESQFIQDGKESNAPFDNRAHEMKLKS